MHFADTVPASASFMAQAHSLQCCASGHFGEDLRSACPPRTFVIPTPILQIVGPPVLQRLTGRQAIIIITCTIGHASLQAYASWWHLGRVWYGSQIHGICMCLHSIQCWSLIATALQLHVQQQRSCLPYKIAPAGDQLTTSICSTFLHCQLPKQTLTNRLTNWLASQTEARHMKATIYTLLFFIAAVNYSQ